MNNTVPSHVPPELVREFSIYSSPGMEPAAGGCPFSAIRKLQEGPRVFWAPNPGKGRPGNWVLTRQEDIRNALQDAETFSSHGIAGFFRLLGKDWNMIPLELDPPEHGQYRSLVETQMSPKTVAGMAPEILERAQKLIGQVRGQGGCEFVKSFAQPFPLMIFLDLFGLPQEHLQMFTEWAWGLLHGKTIQESAAAAKSIYDYLEATMADCERTPRSGMLNDIVHGKVNGRPLTFEEKMGFSFMIFIGGLDTVASSLGFYFRYLAEHPDQQRKLRDHPELIPSALEELLREFSVVTSGRLVTRDVEFAGVQMKAGDPILISFALTSSDPSKPLGDRLDFERSPNPHMTFSVGKHRCLGSNLARREMTIALQEWLSTVPPFRVAPGTSPIAHGGAVYGVKELQLVWD